VITALQAADVDGDGRAEVIVGNTYSTPLTVHEFDGAFRWSTLEQVGAEGNATTPRRGIGLTQLRLCDLDGDTRQEILYGTEDGWLFAVEPRRGEELWQLNIVGKVVGLERRPSSLPANSAICICWASMAPCRHTNTWANGSAQRREVVTISSSPQMRGEC
jgi:hypothetical protein